MRRGPRRCSRQYSPGRGGTIRSPNSDARLPKNWRALALGDFVRPSEALELPLYSLPPAVETARCAARPAQSGLQYSLLFRHLSSTIFAMAVSVSNRKFAPMYNPASL